MAPLSAREKALTRTSSGTSQIAGKAGEFSGDGPTSVQAARGMSLGRSDVPSKAAPRRGEVPYSEAAERSVLAGCLLDDDAATFALSHVSSGDFFVEEHRLLFEAMEWLAGHGWPMRWVPVCHALSSLGTIDRVDQLAPPSTERFLVDLSQDLMAPMWVKEHCGVLKDYSERRSQIERGTQMVRDAYAGKTKRGWVGQ